MRLSSALVLFNALSLVNANGWFGKQAEKARDGGETRGSGGGATFSEPPHQAKSNPNGPKNYIVKYKNNTVVDGLNVQSSDNSAYIKIAKQGVVGMRLSAKELEELENDSNVESVEDDPQVYVSELVRSRQLAEEEPYGIGMVLEDVEWWEDKFANSPPTGSSKVCVVDTGYGNGHEDLPTLDENTDGHNPQSSGEWYIDGHSHGTHCAGSIGAVGDNSKGVVGVIPNSISDKFSFFIGKGLSDSGSGSTTGVMAAVQACVDNGSNVISMSLGGGSPSTTVSEQFYGHYKVDDVILIAAAGNSGNSALSYPGSYKSVMSVAAVDSSENKAGFSQYNEQVEISGPGVSVKSTVTGSSGSTFSYASYSGTSMATPHVAAVAGLLRMYFPDCKAFQIRNAMIVTAKDKGDSGCDVKYGHGIVRAKTAFEYLTANACDPNQAFKEPEGGCAEFACSEDSDCDDDDQNTIDTCESNSCQHACANNDACDDNDPCTVDTCSEGVCSSAFDCGECGGGIHCVLNLKTDNYPGETEWDIKNSSGDEKYNGGGYTNANTEYTLNMCLAPDEYTFYVTDSYGDGFCCSLGNGYYKINVDGTEVVSGGQFGSSKTETFTVGTTTPAPVTPTILPTSYNYNSFSYNYNTPVPTDATTAPVSPPTSAPVAPPTNAPVTPPTNAPVTPPTNAPVAPPTSAPVAPSTNAPVAPPTNAPVTPPTDVDTPSSCAMFVVTLTTDDFGYETSFSLVNDLNGHTRLSGGLYGSSRTYDEITCLDNGRYIFTVSDSHGDGMCCGNGQGGYTVTLGGNVLKTGGEFTESDSLVIEVGPQGPSHEPTPAPVCTQTGDACETGDHCCSGRCGNNTCD
jgi:subtilisin family serine protease